MKSRATPWKQQRQKKKLFHIFPTSVMGMNDKKKEKRREKSINSNRKLMHRERSGKAPTNLYLYDVELRDIFMYNVTHF